MGALKYKKKYKKIKKNKQLRTNNAFMFKAYIHVLYSTYI